MTTAKITEMLTLLGVKDGLLDFDRQLQFVPRNTDPNCNKGNSHPSVAFHRLT